MPRDLRSTPVDCKSACSSENSLTTRFAPRSTTSKKPNQKQKFQNFKQLINLLHRFIYHCVCFATQSYNTYFLKSKVQELYVCVCVCKASICGYGKCKEK